MEDDTKSIASNKTTLTTLGSDIRGLLRTESRTVQLGGKPGIFILDSALHRMTKKLDNLASGIERTPENNDTLASLYEQLNEVKAQNEEILKSRNDLVKQLAQDSIKTGELKDNWEDMNHKNGQEILALAAEAKQLKQDLKASQENAKRAQEDFLKVKHGFDPQVAIDAQQVVNNSREAITEINNQLQARNSEIEHLRAQAAASKQKWQKAQQDLTNEKLATNTLIEKFDAAVNGVTIVDRPAPLKTSFIVKALGEKGLKHITQFDNIVRSDARDRCYKMLSALKSANTQPFVGLSELVQLALTWLKNQTYKTRQLINPWIDLVMADVKQGTIKRLAYYREELKKLLDKTKKFVVETSSNAKAKYEEKRAQYEGFFDFVYHETVAWSQVLFNRTRRGLGWTWIKAKSVFHSIFKPRDNLGVFRNDTQGPIILEDNSEKGPIPEQGRAEKALPALFTTVVKSKGKKT